MSNAVLELINSVLEADARATKGPWYSTIHSHSAVANFRESAGAYSYTLLPSTEADKDFMALSRAAAPRLARMLAKAIEQRDKTIAAFTESGEQEQELIAHDNAELDAIAGGEE